MYRFTGDLHSPQHYKVDEISDWLLLFFDCFLAIWQRGPKSATHELLKMRKHIWAAAGHAVVICGGI